MTKIQGKITGPFRLLLWAFAARRTLLVLLLCCAAGVAAAELAIPWLLAEAIDSALGYEDPSRLDRIGCMMLAVICGLYLLHYLLLRLETRLLYEGVFRLRQRLYTDVLNQPLAFFSRMRSGELMHRIISDTEVFEDNVVYLFSDLPFELMTVMGVLTLMVLIDLRLASVAIAFLAIASAVSAYVGRPLPSLYKGVQAAGATLHARLQEAISGIRTVKAFGGERHEVTRLDETSRHLADTEISGGRVEAFLTPIFDLMELLGVVLVVWYGAHLIIARQITPGTLVAFLAYMEILAGPISSAGKFYEHFLHSRAVSGRIESFLSELESVPPLPALTPAGDPPPKPWPIVFDNVCFTYPGSKGPAIDRLSLTAKPGEAVAIVGRNGAGKSTLMDLLLHFYDPTDGRIEVGGTDLRAWDGGVWREAVGIMTQDVFLFHATIAENIAYGRPTATPAEIEASAVKAGLGDLLGRLPAGLHTVVGERGSRLSGGERQKIALARLFLRNPYVLILDEPTAHLDGEALREAISALTRLIAGHTTFLITHHPELICLAHRIVLLDGGRVVADGDHDALLETAPLYASLLASFARLRTQRKHQSVDSR